MGLQKADKSAVGTKTALVALGGEVAGNKTYKFNEPIYETYTLPGEKTPNTHRRLKFAAGQVYTEAEVNRATGS